MQHLLLLAVAALAIAPAQSAAQYRARLSPVPIDLAMQSTIAGQGTVTATLTGTLLTVRGTFAGLKTPATVANVHSSPNKGIRGPVVFALDVTNAVAGSVDGRVELSPEQLEALAGGRLYVQLHSEKAPEGNLWGWLLPHGAKR